MMLSVHDDEREQPVEHRAAPALIDEAQELYRPASRVPKDKPAVCNFAAFNDRNVTAVIFENCTVDIAAQEDCAIKPDRATADNLPNVFHACTLSAGALESMEHAK